MDDGADLGHRLSALAFGVGECLQCLLDVTILFEHATGAGDVEHGDRQGMRDDIVDLAGDPLSFVARGAVGTLGEHPGPHVSRELGDLLGRLPEAGADLFAPANDRPVGRLTSVVRHYEDGPIALGVVKRNVPVDAVLRAGDVTAAQTVVVEP